MELEPTLSPRFIVYIRNYLLDQGVDAAPSRKQWSRLLLLWLYRPSPFELVYSELIAFSRNFRSRIGEKAQVNRDTLKHLTRA